MVMMIECGWGLEWASPMDCWLVLLWDPPWVCVLVYRLGFQLESRWEHLYLLETVRLWLAWKMAVEWGGHWEVSWGICSEKLLGWRLERQLEL